MAENNAQPPIPPSQVPTQAAQAWAEADTALAGGALPDPLLGMVVGGSYRLEKVLGKGGMGRVYQAQHTRLPRRAAVKVLQSELGRSPELFERFKREAEVTSSLGSTHIINVFDMGILQDGSPYLLMDYLEGRDLSGLLDHHRRFSPAATLWLMDQAVAGMSAAHDKGVIHRDIKPANLFLSREATGGEVLKILDFGLSKVRGVSRSLTGLSVLGTPPYMSPEQLTESRVVDQRTDVWALAVTLFELLSGELPFTDPVLTALCLKIQLDPPRKLADLVPELGPELDEVLAHALMKNQDARVPTVRAFWAEVRPVLQAVAARFPPEPVIQLLPLPTQPLAPQTPSLVGPTLHTPGTAVSEATAPVTADLRPHRSPVPAPAATTVDPPVAAPGPIARAAPLNSMVVEPQRMAPTTALGLGVALAALVGLAWMIFRPVPAPVIAPVEPLPARQLNTVPPTPEPKPEPKPVVNVEPVPEPRTEVKAEPAIAPKPEPKPHKDRPAKPASQLVDPDQL
jgi:serine/threonine-protein kinase